MPHFAAHLLIVPVLLVTLLAAFARRVYLGTPTTRSFIESNFKLATGWEISLDILMMLAVAGFIITVGKEGADEALFVRGLMIIATMAVLMSGLACILRQGHCAMVVRMIAFRSIIGLGLFTAMLGYLASSF